MAYKRPTPQPGLYDLPPTFYDDHVDRDLPSGTELKRTKRYVRVDLDAEAWADLHSDSWYYSDAQQFDPPSQYVGLCASARATKRKLEAGPNP